MECHATGAAYCGDNGIHLRITASNPANPVRNLRVIMPGFEHRAGRLPFHPYFLKSLERYSVIRFMTWQNTNSDAAGFPADAQWAGRTTPAHDTQARTSGAALEHIVGIANTLGAAPWLCVHHLASDAYVEAMATLVRDRLRPDVAVYVEHSNEVWNMMFPQVRQVVCRCAVLTFDGCTASFLMLCLFL